MLYRLTRAALALATGIALATTGQSQTLHAGNATPEQAEILSAVGAERGTLQELSFRPVGETVTVAIELAGRTEEVVLWRHSLRSPKFQVLVQGADRELVPHEAPAPATYRGRVVDYPESVVAASFRDGALEAQVRLADGADLWFVEPLTRFETAAPSQHLVFSSADALSEFGTCGVDTLGLSERMENVPKSSGIAGDGQLNCEIAFDTDVQFYNDLGQNEANAIAWIESRMGSVEGIYLNDVNIAYEITTIIIRTEEPDPYTTNNPNDLLTEFRNHWANQQQAIDRDTAHMFTGRNLQGSTLGIASLSTICNKQNSFGLSQRVNFTGTQVGVTAHELGHSFSAQHCNGANNCFIMCSGIGGCDGIIDEFANISKNAISSFAATSGCLIDPVPPGAPVLNAVVPSQVPALVPGQGQYVSLIGEELDGVTDVLVDGISLGNLFPPGFTIISPTQIDLRVPLLDHLGITDVVATNVTGSDSASFQLVPADPPTLQLGEGGDPELLLSLVPLKLTTSAEPGNFMFVWASFTLAPTFVPGVLDFDIGNNFADLHLVSFPGIEPQGWAQEQFPISLPPGTTIYFQAFEYDVTTQAPPFDATNYATGMFLF